MKMRYWAMAMAAFGLSIPIAFAQQPAIPATPLIAPGSPAQAQPTPATELGKELAALRAEYEEATTKQREAVAAAATDEARAKAARDLAPDRAAFLKRALAIASRGENEKSSDAFDALQFALGLATQPADVDAVVDSLIRNHLDDERIGSLAARYSYGAKGGAGRLLRTMSEKSTVRSVRGKALLALASSEKWNAGKDADRLADAHSMFERIVKEFGDVDNGRGETLGDIAGRALFAMDNLAPGKPCPEITGKDVDGVTFKLSDYIGKVVLLDFWGFW